MGYLVLARKYRPQRFEDIIGQEHVTKTLQNSLSQNRVGHAYLFSGPRGVGKTSTARIFAKALNCENKSKTEPCNRCYSCNEITSGFALDVIEIDGASNRRIEEIRTLKENVKFAPASAKYKIYIIDEVHMLTMEAFNALLKTLEEPPSHIVFIFATTEPNKVPLTILSRCQRFNFCQISAEETVVALAGIAKKEKIHIEQDALGLIAKSASGSLRDALTVLDEVVSLNPGKISYDDISHILGIIDYRILLSFGDIIAANDIKSAFYKIDELINSGYDLGQFVKDLREHFRNLLMICVADKKAGLVTLASADLKEANGQASKFKKEDLLRILEVLSSLEFRIKYSDQKRLLLEITLAKLCVPYISLEEIARKLKSLESKLNQGSSGGSGETPKVVRPGNMATQEPAGEVPEQKSSQTIVDEGIESVKEHWAELIQAVNKSKGSLTAFLRKAHPSDSINGVITLSFNNADKFSKESVDRAENRKLIAKAIESIVKRPCRIKCVLLEANSLNLEYSSDKITIEAKKDDTSERDQERDIYIPASKPPSYSPKEIVSREPIIEKALDIFNGEIADTE
ncbi:MAG: DNA polymerase III subunit gamma/tau [bacterium]